MKFSTTLRFCFILIASQTLLGCSVSNPAASFSSAALNGNWYITGNRQLNQYPLLSLALVVSGNQINAQGEMLVTCAVTAPDEAELNPAFVTVTGGGCSQNLYEGTLTRQ